MPKTTGTSEPLPREYRPDVPCLGPENEISIPFMCVSPQDFDGRDGDVPEPLFRVSAANAITVVSLMSEYLMESGYWRDALRDAITTLNLRVRSGDLEPRSDPYSYEMLSEYDV